MKKKDTPGLVPEQQTGQAIDAASEFECADVESARRFFHVVKNRLQQVNRWHEVGGKLTASFRVVDAAGKEVDRAVQKGDYLKIDIPGPGSVSGEGFDWVQVEAVEEASAPEKEHFGFRVRPAENPLNNKPDVSHFYSPESTSSFTVTRDHSKITAAVFDRNTKVNKPEHSKIDKIRDAVVGTAGIVSFSKIQWKALTDGLVKSETD